MNNPNEFRAGHKDAKFVDYAKVEWRPMRDGTEPQFIDKGAALRHKRKIQAENRAKQARRYGSHA